MKQFQFTKEGFEKIKTELAQLVNTKRPVAVRRLETARGMGDLSENSEYHAAKEDLSFIEGRIKELEELVQNASVVTQSLQNLNMVDIGCRVTVEKDGQQITYFIVGEFEADPLTNKLSHISPIGKAFLGKKIGEIVEVEVPVGKFEYRILDIKTD